MWFCFVIYCLFASSLFKISSLRPNLPYPPPPLSCEFVTWHWSCESTVSDFIGFVCKVLCRSFVANISASATFLWIQSNALTCNHKNMTGYASVTSRTSKSGAHKVRTYQITTGFEWRLAGQICGGVDKTRNMEHSGTSRNMKKLKYFFYEKIIN